MGPLLRWPDCISSKACASAPTERERTNSPRQSGGGKPSSANTTPESAIWTTSSSPPNTACVSASEAANADMKTVADGLAREFPKTNQGRGVTLDPMRDVLVGLLGSVREIERRRGVAPQEAPIDHTVEPDRLRNGRLRTVHGL